MTGLASGFAHRPGEALDSMNDAVMHIRAGLKDKRFITIASISYFAWDTVFYAPDMSPHIPAGIQNLKELFHALSKSGWVSKKADLWSVTSFLTLFMTLFGFLSNGDKGCQANILIDPEIFFSIPYYILTI